VEGGTGGRPEPSLAETSLVKILIEASSYREFLGQAFALLKKEKRFSYASFARRAGFRAWSYPRDIVQGKKRLSAKAVPRFIRALNLPADEAGYFSLLVYRDEPDLAPQPLSPSQIQEGLASANRKIRTKLVQKKMGGYHPAIYRIADWPYVYAALGDGQTGATLDEIARRCRLGLATCRRVLQEMEKYQLVDSLAESRRYRARTLNLVSMGLGEQGSFKEFYFRGLERGKKVAIRSFSSRECYFFSSVFSVKKSRMPELKERLRAVMQDFVCGAEDSAGEELATLMLSFWPRGLESSPCE
jgi:uncharacterized protein (TIGR02147 family)